MTVNEILLALLKLASVLVVVLLMGSSVAARSPSSHNRPDRPGSTVLASIIHKWKTPHDRFNLAMGWILFVHSDDACVGPGRAPSQSPAGVVQGSAWTGLRSGYSRSPFGAGVRHFAETGEGTGVVHRLAIEYTLSVDNVFVFALIFAYSAVPPAWQHKVLFWGTRGVGDAIGNDRAGVTSMARSVGCWTSSACFSSSQVSEWCCGAEQIHPEWNPVRASVLNACRVTRDHHGDSSWCAEAVAGRPHRHWWRWSAWKEPPCSP